MKKNTPEQQLKLLCSLIIREHSSMKMVVMIHFGRMAVI